MDFGAVAMKTVKSLAWNCFRAIGSSIIHVNNKGILPALRQE